MTTINAIGRITKNFELKTGPSGCIYANFSLAVNEGFGENQKAMFFECTAFGAEAERMVKAKAKKGSLIQVAGKFGVRDYIVEATGKSGYNLKINVLTWSYIPGSNGKKESDGENGDTVANDDETTNLDDEGAF